MLVAGGYINGSMLLDDVEVVDLENPDSECSDLTNYPMKTHLTFGSLNYDEQPMICGGWSRFNSTYDSSSKECYYFKSGEWKSMFPLNRPRDGATIIQISDLNRDSKLVVTGGVFSGGYSSSSEILNKNGWSINLPELPVNITRHCTVQYNATTIMAIAGHQITTIFSNKTFLLSMDQDEWVPGPPLTFKRTEHSCGRIRKSATSQKFVIIVVGGRDATGLTSTEIFDEETLSWQSGPELPIPIHGAELVEDTAGGVILIGGFSTKSGTNLDTLYRLPHAQSSWMELPQKLQTARQYHTAFLIPDGIADCTSSS